MTERPTRVLVFKSATYTDLGSGQCHVRVEMHHRDGFDIVSELEGPCGDPAGLKLAAQAAVEGVRKAVGGNESTVSLEGVAIKPAYKGEITVFVAIWASFLGQRRQLLGFSPVGTDHVRAAALAVLSASNRFLNVG